jgi:hypothetical protein
MRWLAFKLISFICVFLFSMEIIFPYIMANTLLPLTWAILLLSVIIVTAMDIIERLTLHLINNFRNSQKLI